MHERMLQYSHKHHGSLSDPQKECHKRYEYCNSIITEFVHILIYVQQHATLRSLFYLKTALHVSGGTTAHHQERKQLYLQYLVFVTQLLLPAAIAAGSSNRVTNTRCCRYSCLRS